MSYPFNTFPLLNRIEIVNPTANIDARYGPWTSRAQALTAFNSQLRQIGLTVGVLENNSIVEYHFKDGVQNNNLVKKSINPTVEVTNTNQSRLFTESDNFKIFHFNTTTQTLTASFQINNLPQGFNIALMNTGTNNLVLSASKPINAIGSKITIKYGGAFVYIQGTELFAVGRLSDI